MQDKSFNNQEMTSDLVTMLIAERRSDRRWKNIRFFLGFVFVLIIASTIFVKSQAPLVSDGKNGYVALVRMDGMIGPGEDFSAKSMLPLLKSAFEDKEAKGVVLDINSGGGTPVQASIIHDAILEMKKKYHKKVIVVGEDVLASGAYYVSVAADKIYVNPNSVTGSIGVIMKTFGFPELIKKMGIERRVFTAGVNKDRLDPFLPENPVDVAKIKEVISEVHSNFEQVVKAGRKGKLNGNTDEIFSGDFWSGETAKKLGLVDELGNLSDVLHNEFHVSAYRDYSEPDSVVKTITGKLGTSLDLALSNHSVPVMAKI